MTVVLGTRPEAIKLAPVILAFRDAPDLRLRVDESIRFINLIN